MFALLWRKVQERLVPNWKLVIRRSWSIWLIVLAGLLSGLEVALPLLPDLLELPQGSFAGASLVVSACAWVARLLAQNELHAEGGK